MNARLAAGGDAAEVISLITEDSGETGVRLDELQSRTGWKKSLIEKAIGVGQIFDAGGVYVGAKHFDALKNKTLNAVGEHHKREPLSNGMVRETLRDKIFAHKPSEVFKAVIGALERERLIIVEHDLVKSAAHSQSFTGEEATVIAALREILVKADLAVPKLDEALENAVNGTKLRTEHARKLVQILVNGGEIIKVTNEFYFSSDAINTLTAKVRAFADAGTDRSIDVAKFKDIAGVSRKYAIPLLEYFDREKVTVRSGDRRLIL